jgi:hypothetical protein
MNKSLAMLRNGFQSSSGLTPEFKSFASTFRSEFYKELKNIGATNVEFNIGHFYISGFFDVKDKTYYFSLSDVRSFLENDVHFGGLLYRTAKNHKDYTGGVNCYVKIQPGMTKKMYI